jgi:hypothetical protein
MPQFSKLKFMPFTAVVGTDECPNMPEELLQGGK